jgi:hypothetical protein
MLRAGTDTGIEIRCLKKGGTIMITQQHENEIQQRAQAPSPAKQHRGRVALFSILGVALPLVAGSMVWWPWGVPDIFDAGWVLSTVVVATALLALVGAFWLRSAWALLLVPVAWIAGEILGAVVRPLAEGGWSALQTQLHFWDIQSTLIPMGVAFVFIWTAIGTALAMWVKDWQQRR